MHGACLAWSLCVSAALGQAPPLPKPTVDRPLWNPTGVIDRQLLTEVSGVVASRKYPGVLWVHADSGNQPKIVAIDSNGARLAEVMVAGAPNIDWEDICADDAGNLYIGDIGNNTGMLPVRYIYRVAEPDPLNPPTAPVVPNRRWRVRYADGERFNGEALFWHAGTLHVMPRGGRSAGVIFRLAPQGEDELVMQPAAKLPVGDATGGDVSRDGKTLLVCAPYTARLYRLTGDAGLVDPDDQRWIQLPDNGAVEACCLTDDDVVLIPENGCVYHVAFERFDAQTRFRLR